MHNENIEYNEFFILAMMQHFGLPSPLVDFSRSMEKALFFAVDKALDNWNDDGSDSLDNYVSLYLLPNNIDWVQASLQTLMEHAAERVDQMISDWRINNPNCKLDTKDFEFDVRNASFSQFRCGKYSDITFLPVNGPAGGRVNLSIPSLNFTCDYYIINDRLLSQQGTFITNFTMDQPLVELMNEKCRNKFFTCINIRKNLIQYIKDKCLDPSGINKESLYFPDDEAKLLSSTLEKIEY
jgi:hypothetical protein